MLHAMWLGQPAQIHGSLAGSAGLANLAGLVGLVGLAGLAGLAGVFVDLARLVDLACLASEANVIGADGYIIARSHPTTSTALDNKAGRPNTTSCIYRSQ